MHSFPHNFTSFRQMKWGPGGAKCGKKCTDFALKSEKIVYVVQKKMTLSSMSSFIFWKLWQLTVKVKTCLKITEENKFIVENLNIINLLALLCLLQTLYLFSKMSHLCLIKKCRQIAINTSVLFTIALSFHKISNKPKNLVKSLEITTKLCKTRHF